MKIKKEATIFVFIIAIISGVAGSMSVLADEVGCCTNPGAGPLACSTERLALKDKECCPKPEYNFPSYYKSAQNPDAPQNSNDCAANFFFPNKACSGVDGCALGCCCSELSGTITPEAQCKGTGLTFYNGQTKCDQLCPTPQCSDGMDNDNNGCADFDGGDLGCNSPADKTESGGSCISEGVGCSNANHIPKLSNFEITPMKGKKKFLLKWRDECSETAVSYDILRCKDSGCTNFAGIGTANTDSFEDSSDDLLFDTIYTYQIKARYNIQTATPTITKAATLGNIECLGQFSGNNFCIHEPYYNKYKNYLSTNFPETFSRNFPSGVQNKFADRLNKAFYCDAANKLVPEGTSCNQAQVCAVTNNKPHCISKVSCNYDDANPFGLFYTSDDCETGRYCFYDRSHSTINSCFGCDPSMSCYDYKAEDTCKRDNCRIGSCKWKTLASQIGIGVCVSENEYNCQWCGNKGTKSLGNLRAFNEVFDLCTRDKSNALSESRFKCYFRNGNSKRCDNVVCRDYDTDQCSNSRITHDEYNKIKNPSADECGINVCQNINNMCVKNADGDNKADCTSAVCESDYFAPNTTLLPILKKGIFDSILIQIYDRSSINSSPLLKTSTDYSTFLCVEPCGSEGHPYNSFTTGRTIILSNLNAFDSSKGNKLLSLNEGTNVIRYYSQDPAKNTGDVKKITIEAHDKINGPKILSINISGASQASDKFYTNIQTPSIEVQFFEPATITHSRLVNKNTGLIVPLQGGTELSTKVSFSIKEALPNGEYTFELNAKNKENIFMDLPLSQIIVIDNNKPDMASSIADGDILNASVITIKLTFSKEVTIDSIKLNSDQIKDKFSTIDNKLFTAIINISDGNKKLEVEATDYAKNTFKKAIEFIVDAAPTTITLLKPAFGTAPASIFDITVETDNNAFCKFSLDDNLEFEFMDAFTATGNTLHTIHNFNKIASGDTKIHKLNVRCDSKRYGISFRSFELNVDTSKPLLKSVFAFPNPIIEKPLATTLTIEADEQVVCKFSSITRDFDGMEGKFEGFDNSDFKKINKQPITIENETDYLFYAACKNRAELISEPEAISLKVNLTIPISIISHTPAYFNSTKAVLAIETNKKSQCKFSKTDTAGQDGEIFGAAGYSHTRQLILPQGKHTFFIVCKDQFLQRYSDTASVTFTIDTTPPIILSVDDSSTLEDKPEFAWSKDNLRVKWNSIDNESKVSSSFYSLIEHGTSKSILENVQSTINNEYTLVTGMNGTSLGLVNGNKYFFRVRSQNIVGLSSNISESDGVTIDTSLKPVNCTNGIKDDKETDVDCGSACDLCNVGKKCNINSDCRTNFCNNGICSAPDCDDKLKNQEESDIDCGGPCKKCYNSQACIADNDCESGFCSFGFCKPQEICFDGRLSPAESDADCGGPCPTRCSEGKNCNLHGDCEEGLQCILSVCKSCADNDKNCNGIADDQEAGARDADLDGLPDDWELQNGLNPNDPGDSGLDSDNDGLTNSEEFNMQRMYGKSTNPNLADTDGDGFSDKEEADKGTNPTDTEDFPKSNLIKMLTFILGATILISGFGYLGYRLAQKRRESKFGRQMQKEEYKILPQQKSKQIQQISHEETIVKEALKKKEEQKEKEREKLFEVFVEHKENAREDTKAQAEKSRIGSIPKPDAVKGSKKPREKPAGKKRQWRIKQKKKPKEDVFTKLREISKEAEGHTQKQKKHAK